MLNNKLIAELQKPHTDADRAEILRLVHESGAADAELMKVITDINLIRTLDLAAAYMAQAVQTVVTDPDPSNKWGRLVAGTQLSEGLSEILKNPAMLNLTQAIMIVTLAMVGGKDGTDG